MANLQKINNKVGTYLGKPATYVGRSKPKQPVTGDIVTDDFGILRVYDGRNWRDLQSGAVIVEQTINDLCTKHPGLAELKRELEEAQHKFDVYLALVKE